MGPSEASVLAPDSASPASCSKLLSQSESKTSNREHQQMYRRQTKTICNASNSASLSSKFQAQTQSSLPSLSAASSNHRSSFATLSPSSFHVLNSKNLGILFSHQNQLPMLPVPKLEETCTFVRLGAERFRFGIDLI